MKHRDIVVLQKIVQEIQIAIDFVANLSLEVFLQDEKTKRAVCMTVINIGELVKNITDDTRQGYGYIRWREAAGFRDIAAHKYQTLNMDDVYRTVTEDFPLFQKQLLEILVSQNDS